MRQSRRLIATLLGASLSLFAFAGTISVTDPSSGDFLGKTNNVSVNISNAVVTVKVTVTATSVSDPTVKVTVSREFTPDGDGDANGSISLNFAETQPQGAYTLDVVATEPGNIYNNIPAININVDTIDPQFLTYNPYSNTFIRDTVLITALFNEPNIDEWRVKVDGNDIPGNTGATPNLSVLWDVNGFANDGSHNIEISIKDLAGNDDRKTFNMTVDRVPPSSSILSPVNGVNYRPGARIPVVVRISDQFNNAVDPRTVDVTLRNMNGDYIGRVSRVDTSTSGTDLVWTGRIRNGELLPSEFKIQVEARDQAGNQAVIQDVTITTDRSISEEEMQEIRDNMTSETVISLGRLLKTKAAINRFYSKSGGKLQNIRRIATKGQGDRW